MVKVKRKMCKSVIRPTMLCGLETVPLTKKQEAELEVAKLQILRFSIGAARLDKVRNEYRYIRGTAHVDSIKKPIKENKIKMVSELLLLDFLKLFVS